MNILCITPVKHLPSVEKNLKMLGNLKIYEDVFIEEIKDEFAEAEVIFTNPNKAKFFLGKEVLDLSPKLKIICTASTGTNHIDMELMKKNDIEVISITKELSVIENISSTAEHALALTLSSLRNLPSSFEDVKNGNWDYTKYIGRQLDHLKIGVIGYGRLGKMYSRFMKPLAKEITFYDPYVREHETWIKKEEDLENLFTTSDIISLHIHVTQETTKLIDEKLLRKAKKNLILVNTSRGEIIEEKNLLSFLKKNKFSKYATDVLSDETKTIKKSDNKIIQFAKDSNQVIVTPHIGGMTEEAQKIAYNHAVKVLKDFINRSF